MGRCKASGNLLGDMLMFDQQSHSAAIELEGLRFMAAGATLIDIPSLRLGNVGTTVVMGPNGAGKSLLLRLMHGLLLPDAGTVRSFGRVMSPEVTRTQALVFQTPVLLRRTAIANVRFVLKTRGLPSAQAPEHLEKVGLAAKAETPARRLSGGERQRLAIALAMATKPRLLFLDEPTANLDPASVLAIEKIVGDAATSGVRIIFVSHDAGQARRLADDVVFMSGGRVVEHTAAADFFDAPETMAAQDYLAGRLSITTEV